MDRAAVADRRQEKQSVPDRWRTVGTILLWTLFAISGIGALLAGAVVGPDLPADGLLAGGGAAEGAAWLLRAECLARHLEPACTTADAERFAARWGGVPDIEVSPGPAVYTVLLAPFVRFAPVRGAVALNLVFLGLALAGAGRSLRPALGAATPWLLAVSVYASTTFGYLPLARPDLMLVTAVVCAFGLAFTGEEARVGRRPPEVWMPPAGRKLFSVRWISVGTLLGVVALHHPVYLVLVPAAALAAPQGRRLAGSLLVTGSALAVVVAYGLTAGLVFTVPAASLAGPTAMGPSLDPALAAWNSLYFLVGRHLGVLPYFLPILLAFAGWRREDRRGKLVAAVIAGAALLVVLHPFDFAGGRGWLGNRAFLPLYGALWLLPTRAPRGWALGMVAILGLFFVWPLWLPPGAAPWTAAGAARQLSKPSRRVLPYETTQRFLPHWAEVAGDDLWMRSLTPAARSVSGAKKPRLVGDGWVELEVAAAAPLGSVYLEFGPGSASELEMSDGETLSTVFRPDGRVGFDLPAGAVRARHPLWWSRSSRFIHLLRLRMPTAPTEPLPFALRGVARDGRVLEPQREWEDDGRGS